MGTAKVAHKQQKQLVQQGIFVGVHHSAGHLDCTDWTLEVEACQQQRKLGISSDPLVERALPEVVPHSARRGAVQDQAQIHLGSPPSLAGPGSTGVQQHNPVDSCYGLLMPG